MHGPKPHRNPIVFSIQSPHGSLTRTSSAELRTRAVENKSFFYIHKILISNYYTEIHSSINLS